MAMYPAQRTASSIDCIVPQERKWRKFRTASSQRTVPIFEWQITRQFGVIHVEERSKKNQRHLW